MNKYNKGSAKVVIAVTVAIILVAGISFYGGVWFSYKNMIRGAKGFETPPPALNNMPDMTNTNSAAGANTNTQEVARPVITNNTVLSYFSSRDTGDVEMIYKINPDGVIIASSEKDPVKEDAKVIARGDINMDGYEDIALRTNTCWASCGNGIEFLLNDKKGGIIDLNLSIPGYVGAGAGKSLVDSITISNGVITAVVTKLTGEEASAKTTTRYKLEGRTIVEVK